MKNKNGFIATGLIYSFFLIFLTLFLTTITSHIKNKVYLGFVEEEIKSELNSFMYVRDFNPGDLISFVTSCDDAGDFKVDNSYVVASVVTGDESSLDSLVLYSYGLSTSNSNALSYENIKSDISTGYLNATYINKILYNFDIFIDASGNKITSYKLADGKYAKLSEESDTCATDVDSIFCNRIGKIVSNANDYYRERIIETFGGNKINKCSIEDAMGVIYVVK